ncbi:hypothetical protein [Actinorugispora endophytica]|uniref:Secreted protein n=1 Tax=Actinorugispora endophytica TaxID=1605990 RepID=A0A4R6V063_9ACTN|nr:hypothetical protein [Actinorugispora endophytica]TDQ53324.1 hypothetical protein EV190_104113 [Actinorugispora endophytica]
MDTGLIIGLAVFLGLAVIAVAAVFALKTPGRTERLKEKFGPEYDRVVGDHGRKGAEHELLRREKRHSELHLRELDPEARAWYEQEWALVQERFVDDPNTAVADADRLMTRVMAERGYPTEDHEQQAADLSVEHAGTIGSYRDARETAERGTAGEATTEELRTAMVRYRSLFAELLEHTEPGARRQGRHSLTDGTRGRHSVPGPRESETDRGASVDYGRRDLY